MSNTPRTDACWDDESCNILMHSRQLERELAEVTKQLHHTVGLLSTTPQFENQHPEDILIALKGGAQ